MFRSKSNTVIRTATSGRPVTGSTSCPRERQQGAMFSSIRQQLRQKQQQQQRRWFASELPPSSAQKLSSSSSSSTPTSSVISSTAKTVARATKQGVTGEAQQAQDVTRASAIAAKLPKSLRPYASHFINQPISHISAFLFLHELTAVLPVGAIFYLIHTTQWSPPGLPGQWIQEGVDRFGRYARKKGWEEYVDGEKGGRLLFEIATAYAVVKLLLPVRIGFSLWATPWMARMIFIPVGRVLQRIRSGVQRGSSR